MALNVLVIAYNRPDKLSKLINRLQIHKEKIGTITFWLNRGHNEETIIKSEKCLETISDANFNNAIIKRPLSHLPVYDSIPDALDYFFSKHKFGLILEDDCLPSAEFIDYLCYQEFDESNKCLISGSNPYAEQIPDQENEIILKKSYFFQVWGWYGSSTIWSDYSKNYKKELNSCSYLSIFRILKSKGLQIIFSLDFAGKIYLADKKIIKTWDYQFSFYLLTKNIKTWVPNYNLVENIGFDNSATNTFVRPKHYNYKNLNLAKPVRKINDTYFEFNTIYQSTNIIKLLKTFRRWLINK